jgi:hypothetical protein
VPGDPPQRLASRAGPYDWIVEGGGGLGGEVGAGGVAASGREDEGRGARVRRRSGARGGEGAKGRGRGSDEANGEGVARAVERYGEGRGFGGRCRSHQSQIDHTSRGSCQSHSQRDHTSRGLYRGIADLVKRWISLSNSEPPPAGAMRVGGRGRGAALILEGVSFLC